jgi:hypothetical protein
VWPRAERSLSPTLVWMWEHAVSLRIVVKSATAEGADVGEVDLGPDGAPGSASFSQVPTISASANPAMNIGMADVVGGAERGERVEEIVAPGATLMRRCCHAVHAILVFQARAINEAWETSSTMLYWSPALRTSKDPNLRKTVEEVSLEPKTRTIEDVTQRIAVEAGLVAFAQRYGIAKYAKLITLGYSQNEEISCVD